MFFSCTKEELDPGMLNLIGEKKPITASVCLPESASRNKTTVEADGKVCWVSGDAIVVNNTTLSDIQIDPTDASRALFAGEVGAVSSSHYWAIYPSSIAPNTAAGYQSGNVTVTLPNTQTSDATAGSSLSVPNYMVAHTETTSTDVKLYFKNLCSIIKIPVKAVAGKTGDAAKLSRIEIVSDKDIWGEATVTMTAGPDGNPSLALSGGSRKMTVNCGDRQLNSTPDTFCVMLPAGSNLLFFRFYDATGKSMQKTLTLIGSGSVRNTVYRMNTVDLDADIPVGALPGKFSVSGTQKVYFSQGNLQYIGSGSVAGESATPPYWRFATNQWDCIGDGGSTKGNVTYITSAAAYNNSSSSAACRDLFGYGTSGYNSKNPWMTSTTAGDYPSSDLDANTDWGRKNPIYNGGNAAGMWRTLTNDEWTYLFDSRSGNRFSAARVHGKNGIVVFPNGFNYSGVSFGYKNNKTANPGNTVISNQDWLTLECLGCLFLPCSYYRDATTITSNDEGKNYTANYWTAAAGQYVTTYYTTNYNIELGATDGTRSIGMCVRLATYAN